MFHVVVDSDATAQRVLDVMLSERTGRVTFMPLNRLKPKNPEPPNASDAIPLLSKIRYSNAHQKAMQQVFGKTCVCKDLNVAAAYVKSHGINTITLDGDKVDRKGALTGGYHDVRRSRIEAIKSMTNWKTKYEAEESRSKEVKAETVKLDQEITRLSGRIQVTTNQMNQVKAGRAGNGQEAEVLGRERERLEARVVRLEKEVEDLESEIAGLGARIEGYREELGQEMTRGLTEEEEQLVDELESEVERRQKEVVELSKKKNEVRRLVLSFCDHTY